MLIDPKSNTPIYKQIVNQLRDAIDAGIYQPGESLPSLRALAIEIRVNPNTIQRAYEELERERIIESRRGIGVFVIDRRAKTARKKHEKQILNQFRQTLSLALQHDTQPTRIRQLFESALDTALKSATKLK